MVTWTWSYAGKRQRPPTYHNNGDGTFSRIIEGIIATDWVLHFLGRAWADQDNDGDLHLFRTHPRTIQ